MRADVCERDRGRFDFQVQKTIETELGGKDPIDSRSQHMKSRVGD